ncbi:MAG: hypothetical protein SPL63_10215 [Roseburia faecis]|nr:hypothetical protein [Roseburia faecis]
MNFLEKVFQNATNRKPDLDAVANLVGMDKESLRAFEQAYHKAEFRSLSDNLFQVNSRQAAAEKEGIEENQNTNLVTRVVNELTAQSVVYEFDGTSVSISDFQHALSEDQAVAREEIMNADPAASPMFTGRYVQMDTQGSGESLLSSYADMLCTKNPRLKKQKYDIFRQGLDLLDMDNILWEMIDTNPNSMGNWLPYIVDAVVSDGFFRIPKTKIVKLPITVMQLMREYDYMDLNRATLDVIDQWCMRILRLNPNQDYFIKTGTHCSKFDFRNAKVTGAKEVRELGEYLLYLHMQDLRMAQYDLSGRNQPVVYGVSTTTEWVVREFIPDVEENTSIYHGLPLHTEYRVFVDFDTDEVLGIHNYWDPDVMLTHFARRASYPMPDGQPDIDAVHDFVTYKANQQKLSDRYERNKDLVVEKIRNILSNISLKGQWSLDVMQNGEDFWLIDMARAENSAFYDATVAIADRRPSAENWLPRIGKE